MLSGKNIILGVTGSISAYKTAFIARLLIKEGANVKVVMTKSAIDFITPLTLATLSKNEVFSDFTSSKEKGTWNNHVDLGLWADYMIIAPATASTLSKMADGLADNFLLAVYLSAKCPVYIAPAMDLDMYKHGSTKNNLDKLESFGNKIIPAESGDLASGLSGKGRLADPENIIEFLNQDIQKSKPLYGKNILITAGPTHEKIDPVRYLGNNSTGKMGFALAERAYELGATVTLVAGPVNLSLKHKAINRLDVVSAQNMLDKVSAIVSQQDVVIMAAAVADYTPVDYSEIKIKKAADDLSFNLKRTTDILAHLGKSKKENQLLVGFALETNNEVENAKQKIVKKNLDFIILNSLNDKGAGFTHNTNKITIISKDNKTTEFELKTKEEVANDILKYLITKL
jgi:phosphopantothenoylcysteine decarboxylase/phosphopantothenate--cysteine ligase